MARARKPRTDEELAVDEQDQLMERYLQDQLNQAAENQEKLAAAGEPEARDALKALRSVTRLNTVRLNEEQLEAINATTADANGRVEDERDVATRRDALEQRIRQEKFEKQEALKNMTARERAEMLMERHWMRWSREGDQNYPKACHVFRLAVGRDAVKLVKGGVFDSHLDVAQFIQRIGPSAQQQQETDWTDDLDRELRELRGED